MNTLSLLILFLFRSLTGGRKYSFLDSIRVCLQLLRGKEIIVYQYNGHNLYINNDSISAVTYHIIYSTPKLEKMVEGIPHCAVAADVGANNGIFSFFLKKKFPDAKVFLFEPSSRLRPVIEKNLQGFKNIIIEEKAVSDQDGEIVFYVNPLSEQTNSISKASVIKGNVANLNRQINEVRVPSVSLNRYFNDLKIHPDTIKVDIQGAEKLMLKGATEILPFVKMSFFEVSFLDDDMFETTDLLRKYFKSYKVMNDVRMGADIMFYNT